MIILRIAGFLWMSVTCHAEWPPISERYATFSSYRGARRRRQSGLRQLNNKHPSPHRAVIRSHQLLLDVPTSSGPYGNPISCMAVAYGRLMFRKSLSMTLIWRPGLVAFAASTKAFKSNKNPRRNSRLEAGSWLLFMASYILLSALFGFACIT